MITSYPIMDMRGYGAAVIFVINTHDAALSCTIQGSIDADFNYPIALGGDGSGNSVNNPFQVAAGNVTPTVHYQVLNNPMPWVRLAVAPLTIPTVGWVSGFAFKQRR